MKVPRLLLTSTIKAGIDMIKYKYKHELLGGCYELAAEKELSKHNIPAKVDWCFPVLTIFCNRKDVKDIQRAICFFRNGEPVAYKDHLYQEAINE